MALTVASPVINTVVGDKRMTVTTVTFDASYPTGGEALVAADVGLNVIDAIIPYAAQGYNVEWAADLLVVFDHILGVEVVDTTDLNTLTATLLCFGS